MNALEWVTVIVIIGSIISIFGESLPGGRFWTILRQVVLFIPIMIIGVILHVAGDFKNHRLGYIFIFLIIGFVGWGMYMGYRDGPASSPWDY